MGKVVRLTLLLNKPGLYKGSCQGDDPSGGWKDQAEGEIRLSNRWHLFLFPAPPGAPRANADGSHSWPCSAGLISNIPPLEGKKHV